IPFSRLRPTSVLPGQFFGGPRGLDEVLAMLPDAGAELVALRMAGLLRAPPDPVPERAVPLDLRSPSSGASVDAAMLRAVRGALLKARGRDLYALLGVPRDADEVALQIAIAALETRVGPEAIALDKLGPARDDARELWALLDDARGTLL